nr:hypothetical protein [Tanacetum cinerariifolium]
MEEYIRLEEEKARRHDMALPPRDQRHQYLRDRVYSLAELGGGCLRLEAYREFILGMGLHTAKEIESVRFGAYWAESARQILDKGDLSAYWIVILSARDFLSTTPPYTSIRDPMLWLCYRLIRAVLLGGVRGLFYQGAWVALGLERQQVATFGAAKAAETTKDAPLVDVGALAWVALGLERQHVATFGAAKAAETTKDAPLVDVGALVVLAPTQAPQPPPHVVRPARTIAQRTRLAVSSAP